MCSSATEGTPKSLFIQSNRVMELMMDIPSTLKSSASNIAINSLVGSLTEDKTLSDLQMNRFKQMNKLLSIVFKCTWIVTRLRNERVDF